MSLELENCFIKTKKKKIYFNELIQVILIPNLDYYNKYLKKILWWDENEFRSAVISSNMELEKFLFLHQNISIEKAKQILYQPNDNN